MIDFRCEKVDGLARAGVLRSPHGEVQTPAFMPVATQATVKSLGVQDVLAVGARMVIMNTYHLWLRPTPEVVHGQGGLHEFSRWPGTVVTDSGGFQAFSLSALTKVTEEGFAFRSHLDGSSLLLSPEESMRVQGLLGSDIAMQLDICPPGGASPSELVAAVQRTTRWAHRCLSARASGQALFGIVQGGTNAELRCAHAAELSALPLDGLALGGFSVGEPREEMFRALRVLGPTLDSARPHYMMGVGTPADIIEAIACGVDMFDCVLPTRNARNGQAFLSTGKLVIKNAKFKDDSRPLEEGCECPACSAGYSRAYLRHLYHAKEILALRLLTMHNLWLYQRIVREARQAIIDRAYGAWSADWLKRLRSSEL